MFVIYIKGVKTERNILGRNLEKQILKELASSPKSELVSIYGRRRVGKTYLIKELFQNQLSFTFTGTYNESTKVQLHQFKVSLEEQFKTPFESFDSWYDAFEALKNCLIKLNKDKVLIFLDELPWMDSKKSNFLSAFSCFWNNWDSEKIKLKLFVCGSATTWMIDKFIGNKGGLYGRVTRAIYLSPFNLAEVEIYLNEYKGMALTKAQVLDIYMILGGIPYYLDMLDRTLPINTNIDNLFFKKNAPLRFEFEFLFRSLFKDAKIYKDIVRTLSHKLSGMTKSELIEEGHLTDNGCLTKALNNLISCEFVVRHTQIGKKRNDAVYRLIDPFSIFYLHFVYDENIPDENFWSNSAFSSEINSWRGYSFETVCLNHINEIKKALGISGILSNVYSWSVKPTVDSDGNKWPGGQIDLIIDRKDNVIDLVEIKYANDEYIITAEYEEKIRKRTELFRHSTKTKKALHTIFVTTYGVKRNNHYNIVQNEIKLNDLFF